MSKFNGALPLHLDAMQGNTEQRSDMYLQYIERVAEVLTKQCAKSSAVLTAPLASRLSDARVVLL